MVGEKGKLSKYMKRKKNIIYVCVLIIFITCGFTTSQAVSKTIYANEIRREQNDIEKLEKIKNLILDAINDNEQAKECLLSQIGDKDIARIYIGYCYEFNYDVIRDKYRPLYDAIKDYSLNESRFESLLNVNGNYYIQLYMNKDCNINIKMEDANGNQVKCKYIDLYMKTGDI